jgi:putative RNA 2'-phosphotransferase
MQSICYYYLKIKRSEAMKPEKQCEQLSRFLQYMLGRAPDEFGLYLENDGWIKIKQVLQVLSEEDGWKHIRLGNIHEIFVLIQNHGLEMDKDRIRCQDRSLLPEPESISKLPKLLYTCVRQRAYAHILKKGISPLGGKESVIMSDNIKLAQHIGKRIDQKPVTLSIHTNNFIENGGRIEKYGNSLFITDYVPADCFYGPPLTEDQHKGKKDQQSKNANETKIKPHESPGSFFPQFDDTIPDKSSRKNRSKKEISWKKERRQKKRR